MGHLVSSPDTFVVFSSLAKLCVPDFSETCVITVHEATGTHYRISYPLGIHGVDRPVPGPSGGSGPAADHEHQLTIRIDSTTSQVPAFRGLVRHNWQDYRPTTADFAVAQLMTDRAVAAVHSARLADLATRWEENAANLERGLRTSRQIGAAVGILMVTCQLRYTDAFECLRQASQRQHRKLHDIAEEVVMTGGIQSP